MKPETKVFQLTDLKQDHDGEGTFEAVFATLDAIDHDGDTYDPGAIGNQDVIISQWNHGSWNGGAGALPIGVGKVFERGNKAIVSGEFNLADSDGRKTYETLKYLHSKDRNVEWSFALPDMDTRLETQGDTVVRVITRVAIPEVSPVLLGAGVGTELLSIKNREDGPVDKKSDNSIEFVTQVDEAVEAVESVIGRAKQIRNLRMEKGKDEAMSKRSTRRLVDLKAALIDAVEAVDEILTNPNDELNTLAATFNGGKNGS